MSKKVFDKTKPTEGEKFFIPMPSDVSHYIHHERMSAEKFYLYGLIIDYFNPIDGYAFPSVDTLAVRYGKVPDTTSKHLEDLKEVGLIDYPEKGFYVPIVPLSEEEFFRKYPEAFAKYQATIKKYDNRKQAARERMAEWRRVNGYTN